jgi:hypothetical protein
MYDSPNNPSPGQTIKVMIRWICSKQNVDVLLMLVVVGVVEVGTVLVVVVAAVEAAVVTVGACSSIGRSGNEDGFTPTIANLNIIPY